MKVSVELMKQLAGTDEAFRLSPVALAEKIGQQLGAVESVLELGPKYAGITIVEIISANVHTNADKLNVYQVSDGKQAVQVVSGDKTLQVGDKVAWLAPGQTVPITFGTADAFVMGSRDMRGQISHGMLASGKELDMNDDNSRVLVLDTDAPAGTLLADAYNLNDTIIDIENKMFTHRPDCFGQLGVAREIAGIQELPFTSPDWYATDALPSQATGGDLKVEVINHIPTLVPRFVAVPIAGVSVGPSPLSLQSYLHRVGIRPINAVVDITNYYMAVTGQPLHAYDYDKVKALSPGADHVRLHVRHAAPQEQFTALNGKSLNLTAQDMLVAGESVGLCIGGIIGGANCEVDEHTKNIILEAATWDMYAIRRTSMAHGLFTDAATRFSKGQSPRQNGTVAAQAARDILHLAGGAIAGAVVDVATAACELLPPVTVTTKFINDRLGSDLSTEVIATYLRNVEFGVEPVGNTLHVRPPFWRTDIQIPEDVVEEIGRLYGYARLPHRLPLRDTAEAPQLPLEQFTARLRSILAAAGNNEVQTYSFVSERFMTKTGQDATAAYRLRNALSPELTYVRTCLLPSLLDKIHPNHKAGYDTFGLFETGKPHNKRDIAGDHLPKEWQILAYVFSASKHSPQGAPFYQAKYQLDYLLRSFHIADIQYTALAEAQELPWHIQNIAALFEGQRAAVVYIGGTPAGIVGEFNQAVQRNFKLPQYVAGFEVDREVLLAAVRPPTYRSLFKFPKTDQDISLKVAADVPYAQVVSTLLSALGADARLNVFVQPLDIYQAGDDTEHKTITLRITFQHHEKTLTTDEVNALLDAAAQVIAATHNAQRI